MLLTALRRETTAVAAHTGRGPGPGLVRAGTRRTAWTQHCLCGQRVPKDLADRRHHCPGCGLTGDRDLVAALIGAHTVLTGPTQPGTTTGLRHRP
ncbi:zinc ribbon domain-containing protein [Dactylosporangium sp. NPDC051485]|uniref:zinc ribbon domain-containing protein n=1 Tax=Dactylosporangium sp. NPDC051485 TaxID=3154846 RepID=UPI00341DD615